MIPKKLICVSDNNELELVRTIKGKELSYEYQFTKSETKKGMLMTINDENLKTNLKREIFKECGVTTELKQIL
jgi:hypothetical protein